MNVFRFSLGEKEFADLVAGRVVTFHPSEGGKTIEVALSDIGWDRMFYSIERAVREKEPEKAGI